MSEKSATYFSKLSDRTPHNLEDVLAENRLLGAATDSLIKRIEKSEARVDELEMELGKTKVAHEISALAYLAAEDSETAMAARLEKVDRELGSLYATIFRDGGHRQAQLAYTQIKVIDWVTGRETDETEPALPATAANELRTLFAQAEQAEANIKAERAQSDTFQAQVRLLVKRELELLRMLASKSSYNNG